MASSPLTAPGGYYAIESILQFFDTSTPGNGIFTVNGGSVVNGAYGGAIVFGNTANAANATVIANGGLTEVQAERLIVRFSTAAWLASRFSAMASAITLAGV